MFAIRSYDIHEDALIDVNKPFSIGMHPWFINSKPAPKMPLLTHWAQEQNCLFIGEAGLDKVCTIDFAAQMKAFESQIFLAEDLQKPLIIHCVKAYAEVMALKKTHQPSMPWIIHGFNKNKQTAAQLIDSGFYLSLGAGFFNRKEAKETAWLIWPHKLLLETDNDEASIDTIYLKACNLLNTDLLDLQAQMAGNLNTLLATKLVQ